MYDYPQSLIGQPSDRRLRKIQYGMIILAVLLIISLVLSISAIAVSSRKNGNCCDSLDESLKVNAQSVNGIEKIAFGSCTSHFMDPQPIWLEVSLLMNFLPYSALWELIFGLFFTPVAKDVRYSCCLLNLHSLLKYLGGVLLRV